MNQFVPYFLGARKPPPSAADTQVHTRRQQAQRPRDVGLDTYHHTFFVSGNWSFTTTSRPKPSMGRELLTQVWGFPKEHPLRYSHKPRKANPRLRPKAHDLWANSSAKTDSTPTNTSSPVAGRQLLDDGRDRDPAVPPTNSTSTSPRTPTQAAPSSTQTPTSASKSGTSCASSSTPPRTAPSPPSPQNT